uniref:Uncharacterized protein n=1 Tax=Timema tahoe TaxID=61484 RepID=A0A7R9IM32_9NEOP|nr:unnamed protein product [Timema tahoe]
MVKLLKYGHSSNISPRYNKVLLFQVNLGGHQWLFNVQLEPTSVPAICLRHDVDGCVWQARTTTSEKADWPCQHVGTFLAFGYVQASKTQKKFTVCAPETTAHRTFSLVTLLFWSNVMSESSSSCSSSGEIDTEALIYEVNTCPVLWDTDCEDEMDIQK